MKVLKSVLPVMMAAFLICASLPIRVEAATGEEQYALYGEYYEMMLEDMVSSGYNTTYQLIAVTGQYFYLFVSSSPFITNTVDLNASNIAISSDNAHYAWFDVINSVYFGVHSAGNSSYCVNPINVNHDLFCNNALALSEIPGFFPTPLQTIAEATAPAMQGTLTEIVTILPLSIAFLASAIGLRKALALLFHLLRIS